MNNYRLTPLQNTTEHRERIIKRTRKKMKSQQKPPKQNWKPVMIGVFALFVTLILATPYIQQAFFNKQDFTVEKVVIPDVPYDSLITSTYIDETNEFIYNTANGFYSFDVAKKQKTLLVDTSEMGRIFDYDASAEWLVWAQAVNNEDKIHVLNRRTNDVKIMEDKYSYGIELQGDTIFYMVFNQDQAYFFKQNLKETVREPLHEIVGEGSGSRPAIEGSRIAIPELIVKDKIKETVVKVYNFNENKLIGSFIFPHEYVETISLKGDKIYGYAWEDEKPAVIGEVDMTTGHFKTLKTTVGIDSFATEGGHFAIAVKKGDSNSVQLFKRDGDELKRISKLPSIPERLVKPRSTEQGTLVVNGEGQDLAMYLIRFD